ncbi:MAG: glutaminyl-peptide cyclotransferase [Prevotellaceae bacterium]|jgi:glutamine cyclotransferase|nr:glutaminyl-peptide cyclotransferase [Prevotellaceae bacterium]
MLRYLLLCLFIINIYSCNKARKADSNKTEAAQNIKKINVNLVSPKNGQQVKQKDIIDIEYEIKNDSIKIDTTVLFVNNREAARFTGSNYKWTMNENRTGRQSLHLSMRAGGKEVANTSFILKYFPPAPQYYSYSIVKQYPHNTAFFTQGLFFDESFLYEGTGQYGNSALLQIDIATGNVIKSVNLNENFFGEGITLINDKIYQLSWQEHQCFIYDKKTFNKLSTLSYANEGWGITTVDKLLAVSDGSSIISFVNPANFAEVRRIEVCNNNGNVSQLNELEFIDGLIWANVWQTNTIVMINPETGAVAGEIDLSGIYQNANAENCLNGIAYDEKNKRIFVTGKHWSQLFEIKIIKNKHSQIDEYGKNK